MLEIKSAMYLTSKTVSATLKKMWHLKAVFNPSSVHSKLGE